MNCGWLVAWSLVVAAGAAEPPARPVLPPAAAVGAQVAFATPAGDAQVQALLGGQPGATGAQLLDYTFGSAPTEWEPTGGSWQVFSRFACDPSWSFFGGYSQGLAAIWNKRELAGDQVLEAYVSFKHGLPWNPVNWSYRPADLAITLCGDGLSPASGYTFIYGAQEGGVTLIRRADRVLAQTRQPEFLPPSYNDVRPSSEDFHRRWWQLTAQKAGDVLRFFVDGRLALETRDEAPLTSGRAALWTVRNGMMVARVRIAYQQELRRQEPAVVAAEPWPPPAPAPTLARGR